MASPAAAAGRIPILILGSGALATLFAARLAAGGMPVTLLGGWPEGLAALRRHGARLVGEDGRELAFPVQVAERPQACAPASHALVLVKAWQTDEAARRLSVCLRPDGLAVSLQNGLGNRQRLAAALGSERVGLGVTTLGATLLGPGRVRPGGEGPVWLERHPRLGPLAAALQESGFEVRLVEDAEALVWGKLVINAAINPLTALLGIPNGELLNRPAARRQMAALAVEAAAVAAALGISLPFADPVAAAEQVARQTAANHSSMLQDVRRGAPTEIDSICGEIVRLGERLGIPTPLNRRMWRQIRALTGRSVTKAGRAVPPHPQT
ncbi:MAG: 2-dehydropantoate 2-reductase [Anaerolineales bacterium]